MTDADRLRAIRTQLITRLEERNNWSDEARDFAAAINDVAGALVLTQADEASRPPLMPDAPEPSPDPQPDEPGLRPADKFPAAL